MTQQSLNQKRCHLHAARQAVCRCPRCEEFFCRECVVEHASQYICSACLGAKMAPVENRVAFFAKVGLPILAAGAFFGMWFFFYVLGQWVLRIQ